jgi:hypothetical protein
MTLLEILSFISYKGEKTQNGLVNSRANVLDVSSLIKSFDKKSFVNAFYNSIHWKECYGTFKSSTTYLSFFILDGINDSKNDHFKYYNSSVIGSTIIGSIFFLLDQASARAWALVTKKYIYMTHNHNLFDQNELVKGGTNSYCYELYKSAQVPVIERATACFLSLYTSSLLVNTFL